MDLDFTSFKKNSMCWTWDGYLLKLPFLLERITGMNHFVQPYDPSKCIWHSVIVGSKYHSTAEIVAQRGVAETVCSVCCGFAWIFPARPQIRSMHSAVSGELLAPVDEYETKTAKEVKQALAAQTGVPRFRQRLSTEEFHEVRNDEVLTAEYVKIRWHCWHFGRLRLKRVKC